MSATLPTEVLEMTEKFMTDPVRVLVKRDELTLEVRQQGSRDTKHRAMVWACSRAGRRVSLFEGLAPALDRH